MSKNNKVILYESNDAARFVKDISGWVDRHGCFLGNSESAARYSGCTHRRCNNCEKIAEKHRLICENCRSKKDLEKYLSMQKKEWDGVTLLYSDSEDEYFNDFQEIKDFLSSSQGLGIEDLRLIICEPNYLSKISEDHWSSELEEDYCFSETIKIAIENFNKVLDEEPAVSWSPGDFAAIISHSDKE